MKLIYTPSTETYFLLDQNGEIVRDWQSGDDVFFILRDILAKLGQTLKIEEV